MTPSSETTRKRLKRLAKPPVVRDSHHGALEPVEAVLEGLGRVHVQVIGRLVEEQPCRATDLEQQDKKVRLLTAAERGEILLAVADQFAPFERPHRRCAAEAVLVQRLDERASSQLGVLVGLLEVPGRDSRAEHEPPSSSGEAE
jgi:hypothetical protein